MTYNEGLWSLHSSICTSKLNVLKVKNLAVEVSWDYQLNTIQCDISNRQLTNVVKSETVEFRVIYQIRQWIRSTRLSGSEATIDEGISDLLKAFLLQMVESVENQCDDVGKKFTYFPHCFCAPETSICTQHMSESQVWWWRSEIQVYRTCLLFFEYSFLFHNLNPFAKPDLLKEIWISKQVVDFLNIWFEYFQTSTICKDLIRRQ